MERLRNVLAVLYFRAVADPALRYPIGCAGLTILAVHRTWESAVICLLALLTAYFVANDPLFRQAAHAKRQVISFLDAHQGADVVRIPTADFARHFDLTFLIPSLFGKEWLVRRLEHRIRVFMLSSQTGGSRVPPSPRAFVSPNALDVYIFLRDRLANFTPEVHFRLAHELGHASGIYTVIGQRNLIGLSCVYVSIAWVVVNAGWSWWLAGSTLFQLLVCAAAAKAIARYRVDEHFYAEVVADYMAARHLAPHEVAELIRIGSAYALVQRDPAIDEVQTAVRRRLLVERLEALDRGEAIDIPAEYLDYSFKHSMALAMLAFLHLAYVIIFSTLIIPSIETSLAFVAPVFVYFLVAIRHDAELLVSIDRRLEAGDQGSGAIVVT